MASDCPSSHPVGQTFGEVVLCGDQVADPALRDALIEGGYLSEDCADDEELGRVYIDLNPNTCTAEDTVCPEEDVPFANECGCGCIRTESDVGGPPPDAGSDVPDADAPDAPIDADAPEVRDADGPDSDVPDVDAPDCDRCACVGGAWDCGEATAEECGLVGPCSACADPDPSEGCLTCECVGDSWSCAPTVACDYDSCIETCSGEEDPEDPLACGENLFRYPTSCERACAGVVAAAEPAVCDDLTPVCAQELPEVELIEWVPPRACTLRSRGGTRVFDSFSSMSVSFDCSEEPEIDWETYRLLMLTTDRTTVATPFALYEADEAYLVQLTAPVPCETRREFSNLAFLLIPAGELPVQSEVCEFGECAPYPED